MNCKNVAIVKNVANCSRPWTEDDHKLSLSLSFFSHTACSGVNLSALKASRPTLSARCFSKDFIWMKNPDMGTEFSLR